MHLVDSMFTKPIILFFIFSFSFLLCFEMIIPLICLYFFFLQPLSFNRPCVTTDPGWTRIFGPTPRRTPIFFSLDSVLGGQATFLDEFAVRLHFFCSRTPGRIATLVRSGGELDCMFYKVWNPGPALACGQWREPSSFLLHPWNTPNPDSSFGSRNFP